MGMLESLILPTQWEQALRSKIPHVTLLGELPLDGQDLDRIAEVISRWASRGDLHQTSLALQRQFPATLSAFLVLQGIFGYRKGDYWTDVCRRTGIQRDHSPLEWGKTFERFLRLHGLPTFDELGGNRFITKILAHGGIPDYCLQDFFEKMLLPAIERPDLTGLSPAELVEEWRIHHSTLLQVDKPAWRFLLYGGRVARDFLARCLDMARGSMSGGEVPTAGVLGLPPRVVAGYAAWLGKKPPRIERVPYPRYRSPAIVFDPWGEGFRLILRPQRLDPKTAPKDVVWHVAAGEATATLPASLHRTDQFGETEERFVSLDFPAERFNVTLAIRGQVVRDWSFTGPTRENPALAFSEDGLTYFSPGDLLAPTHVWIIVPRGFACFGYTEGASDAARPVSLLAEAEPPGFGWAEYQFQLFDLEGLSRLELRSSSGPVLSIRISPPVPSEPRLRTP